MPTSLQSALLRARQLEARREALRQLPNETIAAIQPAVFKPQPSRTPSVSYPGPQPYCRYCRKFGSRAQHCGHNPAVQYTGESQYRAMSLPFVSLNNNDWQSPLVVEGLLNGKGAKLLIDTGASCSVINRSLAKISHLVPLNGRLIAANGTFMPILGQVAGSVSIGRCTVQHQFLCADVAWDAILGMDFLRAHRIVIDFDRQLLVINERPESIGQSIAALKLDNSRISEMLLGARVDRETNSEVAKILNETRDIFDCNCDFLGRTRILQHRIDTGQQCPIYQTPRLVLLHYQAELDKMVHEMLESKVIRPSSSPWASPIVLAKKKDGGLRICVDYRRLNAITKRDSFPLPRIDSTLGAVSGAKWFSTLDLASGYWQVEVHPDDREKTAFAVPSGLYEFETMPFGLANAPATFQRLMNSILRDIAPNSCLIYLDDIIVHGRTIEEHNRRLKEVLLRLKEAGLTLRAKK
ncbi:Retrovirus Pol polyprotein from transposon 17.6 [Fasciola gigantica]|uniref:Retrovirus Pol polyprotein from transposon 17.6 n=1 Tax=Fasciola gigantica TaxID=46835 RepID=A0A504YTU4_FASGI|nr:Retrovirus Pol polyprotein from transposon 17.6 [Fasciola gigantica]